VTTALTKSQQELAVGSRGVRLDSLEDAFRFSEAVIKSGMAPKGYTSPMQVLVAIQRGAEVGLPPMQALDSIAVINGRPTIYGDALPALVHSSGLMEWIREDVTGDGDGRTAVCVVKRRDSAEECRRSFSMRDAKRAGLVGKAGPWTQYPDRMLAMRARAWAFRDTFADALRGLHVREEVEDYAGPTSVGELPERKPLRLSELPDAKPAVAAVVATAELVGPVDGLPSDDDGEPRGSVFGSLLGSVERLPDDADDAARDELLAEIAAECGIGGITQSEAAELRRLMAGKIPFGGDA
jgi:hypothetical protein